MIKAKIKSTGKVVEVKPYKTEIYVMVGHSGGIMGELHRRSELTIIGDNELEFVSLVKKMREAQRELDTCSIGDYDFRQHCAAQLESEVDECLKKMEV